MVLVRLTNEAMETVLYRGPPVVGATARATFQELCGGVPHIDSLRTLSEIPDLGHWFVEEGVMTPPEEFATRGEEPVGGVALVEAAAEGGVASVVVVAAARSSLTASVLLVRTIAPVVSWVLSRRIRSITSRSYAALPAS